MSLLRPTKLPILGASLALNDSNASYPVQENPTKKVGLFQQWWLRLNKSLHPVALLALSGSLCFTAWIAAVQYHGEPHIFDASAYLFQAKMYALGRISVPVPPAVDLFPGPFMVQNNGQWFGQYAPGTGLALVPGLWLGVPWLVEPIMGTLALLGIGLIAARLYDRKVATLAVLLGTLSPFYSYLAASYLSHTVELFYLVWGLWAVLRFAQGEENWNMLLAGICFGMASLTRDEVTLLFMTIMLSGVILLYHRAVWQERGRWFLFGLLFLCLMVLFTALSWRFNQLLTGSVWVTPRSLFFAGDHWGFGPGVGFYGQHTLAAGLVNLDELLTILAIDLYGWPFYFSLLFPVIPFLTGKVKRADWLLLAGAVIMTSAYVGYFYHGIYLGPRYLFETLPFLLILTARGIFTLAGLGQEAGQLAGTWLKPCRKLTVVVPRPRTSIVTIALVLALVACNLVYYLPRQVDLHRDYTGLPAGYNINLENVYHPTLHRAIVVTDDANIYQFVLFPLNDPLLHGDVLYAYASTPADYAELRAKLPGRTLYYLQLQPDGNVKYLALQP